MRVKLPGRIYQHQKLQSEDSPVKPSRMLGLTSKAKSCRFGFSTAAVCDEFDVRPIDLYDKSPVPVSAMKQHGILESPPRRMEKPKLALPKAKQTSFRDLFSSREVSAVSSPSETPAKSKKKSTDQSKTRSRRQKSAVTPVMTRTKLVRIAEELPTASKSAEFDSPTKASLLPPLLRRARSAPQTSSTTKTLDRNESFKSKKQMIRELDLILLDKSNYGRTNEVTLREVPPVHSKTKTPLRNPYKDLPNLSSSRGKPKSGKPPLARHLSQKSNVPYALPLSVKDTAPLAPPSTKKPSDGSLKSLSLAYKKIMVEFGDDSSDATTGW